LGRATAWALKASSHSIVICSTNRRRKLGIAGRNSKTAAPAPMKTAAVPGKLGFLAGYNLAFTYRGLKCSMITLGLICIDQRKFSHSRIECVA
jgi:hypothetical protein